jgi:hypothetical protein
MIMDSFVTTRVLEYLDEYSLTSCLHVSKFRPEALNLIRERNRKKFAEKLILQSAERGDDKFCCLAKEWGATDWEGMLRCAAQGGHEHLCRLAKEWGATDWNWMLANAARGGHEYLCRLAKEWGARNWDWMLSN